MKSGRSTRLLVSVTLFPLVLLAVPASPARAADAAVERAALMDADRAFARDSGEKGSDAWLDWFAEDGLVVTAEGPLAEGREAVRRLTAGFLDNPDLAFSWEPERAEVAAGGDMGWTIGHYRAELKRADGPPAVRTGRYMTVWKRTADGRWRVAADIDVSGGG